MPSTTVYCVNKNQLVVANYVIFAQRDLQVSSFCQLVHIHNNFVQNVAEHNKVKPELIRFRDLKVSSAVISYVASHGK